jgi:hypothetical protein
MTMEDYITQLLTDEAKLQAAHDLQQAIVFFLNALKAYKDNAIQRLANHLPPLPPPVPPAGFIPPADPAPVIPPPPPPRHQPIIEPNDGEDQYPAPGDNNPAGTVVDNPYQSGQKLEKVMKAGPFGIWSYWIPKA